MENGQVTGWTSGRSHTAGLGLGCEHMSGSTRGKRWAVLLQAKGRQTASTPGRGVQRHPTSAGAALPTLTLDTQPPSPVGISPGCKSLGSWCCSGLPQTAQQSTIFRAGEDHAAGR